MFGNTISPPSTQHGLGFRKRTPSIVIEGSGTAAGVYTTVPNIISHNFVLSLAIAGSIVQNLLEN